MNKSKEEFHQFLRLLTVLLLMAFIFVLGSQYSVNRHFQPDEFVLSKSINMLNFPKELREIIYIQFYMVLLSFVTNQLESSENILKFLRLFSLFILLSSIFIMANFSLKKETYFAKFMVLIFFLTQYPLWRLGIEIRHEVYLMLALGIFCYFFLKSLNEVDENYLLVFLSGLSMGFMGQAAYKGLVYSIPLSGLIYLCLVLKKRYRSMAYYSLGYLVFSFFGISVLYFSGHLGDFIHVYKDLFVQSQYERNFWPTEIYKDLLYTTPLTLLAFLFCCWKGKKDLGTLFTGGIVLLFTVLLFISPVPFRYNIIVYLSSILIFISYHLKATWIEERKQICLFLVGVNLLILMLSAGKDYYLKYSNAFQLDYIKTAELLTNKDSRIVDAMGIVATRPPTRKKWALYYAEMPKYLKGELGYFSDAIKDRLPEVAITNYRWSWLREEDLKVLVERYVKIGQYMYILGTNLKNKAGDFHIYKKGRYKVIRKPNQSKVKIDDKEINDSIVVLDVGNHSYKKEGAEVSLLWLGPRAKNVPYLFIHPMQPFIPPIQ